MLRVYALPAVEAATPEPPNPSSPQSSVDPPIQPVLPAPTSSHPAPAAIAPPEAPTAPEFSTPKLPAVSAQPAPSLETSHPTPAPASSSPTPTSSPAANSEAVTPKPAEPASAPKPTAASDSDASDSDSNSGHPNSPKAETSAARTVAGMRQILEKRLGQIVTQDKTTREAQWQQNLLYTALQYAWAGRFEEARQIASHPALPEAMKTDLLGKILAIELQRQANPVGVAQQSPTVKPGTPTAQPGGRVVPSGYASTGLGTSWSSSGVVYPGLPGGQCPAVPATKLLASKSVSLGQSPQSASGPSAKAKPAQFPAFVPILGQSLASRMVQHSQSAPPPSAANSLRSFAPAISLTGVAAGSLKQAVSPKPVVQLKAAASPAKPSGPTQAAPSTAAQAQPRPAQTRPVPALAPQAIRTQAIQTQPIQTQPIQTPQPVQLGQEPSVAPLALQPARSSAPAAGQAGRQTSTPRLPPGLTAAIFPNPDVNLSSAAPALPGVLPKAEPLPNSFAAPLAASEEQDDWQLDPVSATVNRSLEQFESILPDWVPNPLNFAWIWWGSPEQGEGTTDWSDADLAQSPTNRPSPNLAPAPLQTAQLAQSPLLQSLATNWSTVQSTVQSTVPMQLEFGRSARKISLPITFAKSTATPPKADLAELVALSCASAQLADRLNSYVIDPAVSKQLGWVNLMFPLPIASIVTSAFGWRIHPISGNLSFHTGLDLGAPTGTPVLAALPGRVVGADYMGGYGLAVIVETSNQQRNLYAHLSGISVQPGMQINQGTVLGWVGSTGNSTGPHLHFETLVETKDGWTAVDPLISAGGSR